MPINDRENNPQEYRFGFNGKLKDIEWTGNEGSHLDFGARIYDSRIGRFLTIDRFTSKFPMQSPYLFASNSPISNVDIKGDSTAYYSQSGELLWVSHDQLDNSVNVVLDENLVKFESAVAKLQHHGLHDTDEANKRLRSLGKNYNLVDYKNWAEREHGETREDGELTEKKTYLVDNNGEMEVFNTDDPSISNDLKSVPPPKRAPEGSNVWSQPSMHTHPLGMFRKSRFPSDQDIDNSWYLRGAMNNVIIERDMSGKSIGVMIYGGGESQDFSLIYFQQSDFQQNENIESDNFESETKIRRPKNE